MFQEDKEQERLNELASELDGNKERVFRLIGELTLMRKSLEDDIKFLDGHNNSKSLYAKRSTIEVYNSIAKTELDAEARLYDIITKTDKLLTERLEKLSLGDDEDDIFDPANHVRQINKAINQSTETEH